MEYEEGYDYVTIKKSTLIIVDGQICGWTPDDAKDRHGAILKTMHQKYMKIVFKVESPKPYPERRRIFLSGVFFEGSIIEGEKSIKAWKEDLVFYTFRNGMLEPHAIPKKKRKRSRSREEHDIACDLED